MKKNVICSLFLVGIVVGCGNNPAPSVDPSKQTEGIPGTYSGSTVDQEYWQYMMENFFFYYQKNTTLHVTGNGENITICCDYGKIAVTDSTGSDYYHVLGYSTETSKYTLEYIGQETRYDSQTGQYVRYGDYKKTVIEVFPEDLSDAWLPQGILYNSISYDQSSGSYKGASVRGQYRVDYQGEGDVEWRSYTLYNAEVKFSNGLPISVVYDLLETGANHYSATFSSFGTTSVTLPVIQ